MEEIKPSLTEFIRGEDFWQKILVVESADYLAELRENFPTAEIFFITMNEDFHSDGVKQRFPFFTDIYRHFKTRIFIYK